MYTNGEPSPVHVRNKRHNLMSHFSNSPSFVHSACMKWKKRCEKVMMFLLIISLYIWLPQDWKRLVFIPIPKKGNAKECSNNYTIALISHASKVTLKILQARLLQYMNHELPDVQAGFRKGRDQTSNCQNPLDHGKSKRVPEKHLFLLY